MEFNKLLYERASIKRFSTEKPQPELIQEIIEAGNLAPSPGNLPILRYIIVEDENLIKKIAQACQQNFITKAPYVIVICSDAKNIIRAYNKRAETYVKQQAGAAIENMLLKITNIKLVSCWVGAFSDMIIRSALNIPNQLDIEAILPIGNKFIKEKTKQRRKPGLYDRIFFDSFGNKYRKPLRSATP